MVVGHAEGVGPAQRVGAGVNAELCAWRGAEGDGGAHLVVPAVGVVGAGRGGLAPLDEVVWVLALEALRAQALSDGADGVGAAADVAAEVLAGGPRHRALIEGIADEAESAAAVVAAGVVDADSVLPAHVAQALVDVTAAGVGDAVEAALADAGRAAGGHGAVGVGAALDLTAAGLAPGRGGRAAGVGVAEVVSVADASRGCSIFAVGSCSTSWLAGGWRGRGLALQGGVAEEAVGADADSPNGVAPGIQAADCARGAARLHALSLLAAHLSGAPARLGRRAAQVRRAGAARVGVAEHSLPAGAGWPGGGDDAPGVPAALDSVALRDAGAGGVLLEAGLAAAPSGVVLGDAVGVL